MRYACLAKYYEQSKEHTRPVILMEGKKRLSRAAMLVLLGALSILISGASTLSWEDLLLMRRMTVNTQRSRTAADMDAAMMIDKLPISKSDQNQEKKRQNVSFQLSMRPKIALIDRRKKIKFHRKESSASHIIWNVECRWYEYLVAKATWISSRNLQKVKYENI